MARFVEQYAFAWSGRRIGPWRARRSDAELDALREGRAQRCRDSRRIFLIVPADIVTRKVEPPMQGGTIIQLHEDRCHRGHLRLVQ